MLKKQSLLLSLFVVGFIGIILPTTSFAGRCPAGESGCTVENAGSYIQDRVNQGAQNVLENNNPYGRVNEVRDTVRDCIQCGMDAIREGSDRIGGGSGTGSVQ